MEGRLIKAKITVRLKDEKADKMRQWEGLKRQRGEITDWLHDVWTISDVFVC